MANHPLTYIGLAIIIASVLAIFLAPPLAVVATGYGYTLTASVWGLTALAGTILVLVGVFKKRKGM